MKTNRIATLMLSVVVPGLALQNAAGAAGSPAKFGAKWQALIGEWKGEKASGGSSGACGFHLGLTDHVIVRTTHAVLPRAGATSARAHEVLIDMVHAT